MREEFFFPSFVHPLIQVKVCYITNSKTLNFFLFCRGYIYKLEQINIGYPIQSYLILHLFKKSSFYYGFNFIFWNANSWIRRTPESKKHLKKPLVTNTVILKFLSIYVIIVCDARFYVCFCDWMQWFFFFFFF